MMIIPFRYRVGIFFTVSLFALGNIFAVVEPYDKPAKVPFIDNNFGEDESNFYLIVSAIADSVDLGKKGDFYRAINDIQKWGSSCKLMRDQYKKFLDEYCSDDETDKEKLLRYLFRKRLNRDREAVEKMSIEQINNVIGLYWQIFTLNPNNLHERLAVNNDFFKSFVLCNDEGSCNVLKKRLESFFVEYSIQIKEIFNKRHVEGQTHLTLAFKEGALNVCNFLISLFEDIFNGEDEVLKRLFNPSLASDEDNEDESDDEEDDDIGDDSARQIRKNLLWWTPLLGAIKQGEEGEFLADRILNNLKNIYREDKAGLLEALKKRCEDPRDLLDDDGYIKESYLGASPLSFALRYSTFDFFKRLFDALELACDNNLDLLKDALNNRRHLNGLTILMDACLGIEADKKISYLIDMLYVVKKFDIENVFVKEVLCQNSSTAALQRGTSVLLYVLEFCSAQVIDKFIELCDQSINSVVLRRIFTESDYRELTALTLIICRCKNQDARCDKWLTVFNYMKDELFKNDPYLLKTALVGYLPNIEFCVDENCLSLAIAQDDLMFVETIFEALKSVFKKDQDGYKKYLISRIVGTRNNKNVFQYTLKKASPDVIRRVYEELKEHVQDLRSFLLQKDYYGKDMMTFAIKRGDADIIRFVFDIVRKQNESFASTIFENILLGLEILVKRNDLKTTRLVCDLLREFYSNDNLLIAEEIFPIEKTIEYIFAFALRGNDILYPLAFVKNGSVNNSARNYLYNFFRELGIFQ